MSSEEQLSGVLSEFARTMVTDFPIQAILDHLVERIVDVLPVSGAGVTLIVPGADPHYVAASDASALRFEKLQTELGEGPCLAAYRTGTAVAVPDLRQEMRFPKFAQRALEAGLVAVFTFPLRHGDSQLGALDLYGDRPGPLDATTMESAQTLADVAAAYLLNAQAREDLRDASDRSRERALHDSLTGLPNRALLLERLDHAVLRARRSGKMAAVLFTDLDRFKQVNDLYGHQIGDELLVAVGERLTDALRSGDTLARMSGDEFVILCEDLNEPAEVDVIAARINAAIAAPYVLSGIELTVTASVGIAYSGRGEELSEQLLQDADTAMYQAKRKGGAQHQIIDLREQHVADERANLEHELLGATERGELRTQYQPIVDTRDGRVTGAEALVRWDRPSRVSVMPAILMPIVEHTGLSTEIGTWILERACADRQRWCDRGGVDDFTMSVNVGAGHLMAPDFAASVAAVLSATDTRPDLLSLEVTEGVFVDDGERALVVLTELHQLGVKLALDDFGTGYSSLSYLRRFPIDIVKIDQAYIADLEQDLASDAIVVAVIDLAHRLGQTVVAEGVETPAQHRELIALGCDASQGYYFARPMAADDLETLMQERDVDGAVHLPALAASGARADGSLAVAREPVRAPLPR